MTEVWKNIFRNYIKSYEAIQTLKDNDVLEEESVTYELKLLDEIIVTMRTEVED